MTANLYELVQAAGDETAVMAAARVRWGDDAVGDDNEADALWVAEVLRRRVAADGGMG